MVFKPIRIMDVLYRSTNSKHGCDVEHKSWNEFLRKIFLRVCESQEQQLTLTPHRAVPVDDED